MKKQIFYIVWILFFTNFPVQAVQEPHFYEGAGSSFETRGAYEEPEKFNEETAQFLKAKELVFKSEWKEARTQLDKYLKDYPSGNYRDEALYWLAYSLNRIAMKEILKESLVSLMEEASHHLKVLSHQYPESLWQDDAHKLAVDISGILGLMSNTGITNSLRMTALDALVHLEPEVAVPVFRRLLESDPDPEIRKRSVTLLGRYFSSHAHELLENTARSDKDRDVRKEAAFLLERAGMRGISTRLNYHVYGCRLLDKDQYGLFPEKKIKTVDLPPIKSGDTEGLLDAVRDVFEGETSRFLRSSTGQMPFMSYYLTGRKFMISHRAGDYQIWIDPDKLKLSTDNIRGEVQFRSTKTRKNSKTTRIYEKSFHLKEDDDKLLVMRSGDRLSLVMLQFGVVEADVETLESLEIKSHEPLFKDVWRKLARTFRGDDNVVHKTSFSNLMGWEIHSSRESWSLDDITGKSGKYDFGKAEAVSQSPEGWKLIGSLQLLRGERRLIGRKAILLDQEDRIVASGDEITVPVDRPSEFKVTGRRKIKEAEFDLPDYGRLKVESHFTLKPGVKIQTTQEYFNVRDFEENLINFGQAKAILPEKGSPSNVRMGISLQKTKNPDDIAFARTHDPDRSWRLFGDIFWIQDQDRLIGFGAILTDPDREIKAMGLISVPIEDPASYRILGGKAWKKKQLLLSDDERRTRYFFPTLNSNVQGWEVYTTLHSSDYGNQTKWDFSMAQATRHHDGQDWILIGHIMLLRQEREFLGRQAALINSKGEIVFGTEIRVSTDNPSQNTVVKK